MYRLLLLGFIYLNCTLNVATAEELVIHVHPVAYELQRAATLENNGDVKGSERVLLAAIETAKKEGLIGYHGIALNNLAVLYAVLERPADAERYFKRAISVVEEAEESLAVNTLARTKLHLASLYVETNRTREAEKLDLPAVMAKLQNPQDQARVRSMLASIAMAKNDLARAEEMYLGVLSFWQEHLAHGLGQTETATALNNLGIIAWRQNRTEAALTRLERSLGMWRTVLGEKNPTLAKTMSNLATVCVQAKRYDEAARWLEQADVIAQHTFGEVHPLTISLRQQYAEALKKAGRKEEAKVIARAASEARKIVRSPSVADYTLDYRDVVSGRTSALPR
jgi:tetratricopeptide (TPR) repeat protein